MLEFVHCFVAYVCVRPFYVVRVGVHMQVHIALGKSPGTVSVEITPSQTPLAVRYAWGATGGDGATPNGADVSCCEGDGENEPCVPTQCPLLSPEPLAPFGALPIDPFIAEITVAGKALMTLLYIFHLS